jgi:hypothetical protein
LRLRTFCGVSSLYSKLFHKQRESPQLSEALATLTSHGHASIGETDVMYTSAVQKSEK